MMQSLFNSLKVLSLGLLFCHLSCLTGSNNPEPKTHAPTALQNDLTILKTTLEEAHPGLYWYTDTARMNSLFDSVKTAIASSKTSLEFFKMLMPLIANIKCVHTNIRLPEKAVANQLAHLLPFDFICQQRKLYIRKGFNTTGHEGAEILAINDLETGKILETLFNSIPADGYNETFKSYLLSSGAFREGYALYYGQPGTFTIQAKDMRNRQLYKFTVPSMSPRNIPSRRGTPLDPFVLTFDNNTAILAVNTFQLNTKRFADSIALVFQTIKEKKAKHLVIDLRQNGGGTNDNVSTLYSYIATAPFRHLKRAEMTATSLSYPKFVSNPQSISEARRGNISKQLLLVNDRYAGTKITNPVQENIFRGSVVLLISGKTTSAASELAAITHFQKRAKILGEETGGCYYGANGGSYLNLKLPNSGIEITIPTIRIFNAVDEDFTHQPPGRGTFPDYHILPTIDDIINENDVQMQAALGILDD